MSTFDYTATIAAARQTFSRLPPTLTVLDDRAAFLADAAGSITAQSGEDGLLAALFDRIGIRNRWCFEVGAHDGKHLSNTWALRQDGWDGVLIEADRRRFVEMCRSFDHLSNHHLVHARVSAFGTLDRILADAAAPGDLDLGVIDVDGPDVFVWEGMRLFTPRVMLVEYSPRGDGVQPGQPHWQAGLARVIDVGRRKGYVPLATTKYNVLFALESAMREGANDPG